MMKKLLTILLCLPRLLLKLVWQLVRGCLQTLIVLVLLIFGLIYYSNHSDSSLANSISSITEQVVRLLDTLTGQPTGFSSSSLSHQISTTKGDQQC
ncbi:hypothetical protein KUG02_07490 [Streptococcus equi subsp. zooepidemicus]|uniref:hypothetical protein n=1 Tax=Streptococcus equi TaxID=1336 RepID=UPI0013F6110D|nr:hypothetical protein [Streptococcus equi]MCD3433540.1 hypothetical protein [Streptococcus equi subsp. zooepidemicus]QWN60504.1 hypothetical protein GJ622_06010 [Streptococcus equi subsp. zooepidemicus]HEL1187632.1 hypothetical protein [Streptococcus equi subsp. zooepidemicus]